MDLTPDQIAGVIHEANRQLKLVLGHSPGPHWMECDQQLRESVINGVRKAQEGMPPKELHEEWVQFKAEQGWTWGAIKDVRHRKHPCMVPYAELPPDQQIKNHMFHAMVRALSQGKMAILTNSRQSD